MTLSEIHEKLETLPSSKAYFSEQCLRYIKEMQLVEVDLELKLSELFRDFNSDTPITAIKTMLAGHPDVVSMKRRITELKFLAESEKVKITLADDQFTGVKLKARLMMAELGAGV